MRLLIKIFILFVSIFKCDNKIVEGEIFTPQNWVFLTRFCFFSRAGKFSYDLEYPVEYQVQNLLLYYDSLSQWPAVYKSNKSCREREDVLSVRNGQVINLTDTFEYSKCYVKDSSIVDASTNETKKYLHCSYYRTFDSARERWWYIALSNCDSKKGLRLKYRLVMTNDYENSLLRHFSADQFYILHTDFAFAIFYYVLLFTAFFEAYLLSQRHLFHVTYKLFLLSLGSQGAGLTVLTIYYAVFANEGTSFEMLKLIGEFLEATSTLIFLLLLILLAKGFTITRARLKANTRMKISLFMSLYATAYAGIFLYERLHFDPGEVLYAHESVPGYVMIGLRLVGWCWFVYSIIFTLIHYPLKSSFFTKLFLLYSIWFVSAPIVIFVSTFVVPKWMREKIINAVELFISAHAHFVFLILTRPSKANKNFPFHVRTTQIDIMCKAGEVGGDSMDNFTQYSYAPTKSTWRDSNRNVFSVTNGDMVNGNQTNRGNSTLNGVQSGNFNNFTNQSVGQLPMVDSDPPL